MQEKGVLTIISGFSGAGKGTIVKELLAQKENYSLSISSTTRQRREHEEEGIHYNFLSREAFQRLIDDDALFEHAEFCGNLYGTPRASVEALLSENKDVILEIELQGALQVKAKYPETLLIFIVPPSVRELRDRLVSRGTESMDVIHERMKRAFEELEYIHRYDFLVVNDDLQKAVDDVHHVVLSEKHKIARNLDVKEKLKLEFEELLKGE